MVISMLGVVIKYVLNIAFLGWFDRICGIGFGLLKGILLVSVLLIIFTAFLPKGAPLVKESVLAPHMAMVSERMARVVSRDMKHQFAEKIEELKKAWEMAR
jgi:membrane protein required for colicin V production